MCRINFYRIFKKYMLELSGSADLQNNMPRLLLLLAISFWFMVQAQAREEVLILENGDRISGELVSEENGTIVFRSAVLGEIRVPAAGATIRQQSKDTDADQSAVAASAARAMAATPFEGPQLDRTGGDKSAPEEAENPWKRRVDFGLTAQTGKKELANYSLRLEAGRTTDRGQLNFAVNHRYGKADGALFADATDASALITRNVSEELFWRGQTRYETDNVLGVEHSAEQSVGLGYTLFDSERLKLDVGGGAAVRHREAYGDAARWDGLFDAFGKFRYAVNERLSLSQDFWMTTAPTRSDDFRLRANTALVNQLTEMLNLSIRYEVEMNRMPTGRVPDTQRLITAVGCVF